MGWIFWIVLGGLFVFAVVYDRFTAWAERRGYIEGYVSLFVAFGVFITLSGLFLLNRTAAKLALLCFIASGIPMMAGSMWRYMSARERGQRHYWGNDDESQGVAE